MKSSFLEVPIEFKYQKIYAILDYLMECSRNHGLANRVLEPENSFISIMEDAVLDSALIIDSHTVVSPAASERANVPKKHVDSLPKFCPPRKGVSPIRSFPPGCGRGAPQVRVQDRSKCLQNDSSQIKNKPCHGVSRKNADKLSAASFSGTDLCKSMLQSPIIPWKESVHTKFLEDTMRNMTGNKDKSMGIESSGEYDCLKFGQGRLATGPEPMVRRNVVQALMAAPNCPWRQGKRMRKLKPIKSTSQGKGL